MKMHTLYPDVEFSRRKRLHHITNECDEPIWSGARIAAAFAWLAENGQNEFRLEGGASDARFLVQIHRE